MTSFQVDGSKGTVTVRAKMARWTELGQEDSSRFPWRATIFAKELFFCSLPMCDPELKETSRVPLQVRTPKYLAQEAAGPGAGFATRSAWTQARADRALIPRATSPLAPTSQNFEAPHNPVVEREKVMSVLPSPLLLWLTAGLLLVSEYLQPPPEPGQHLCARLGREALRPVRGAHPRTRRLGPRGDGLEGALEVCTNVAPLWVDCSICFTVPMFTVRCP